MKPVELGGLTLSQLSALSLLEISSSELEMGEPTSTSSNFLLRLALGSVSIWLWLAWRAQKQKGRIANTGPTTVTGVCQVPGNGPGQGGEVSKAPDWNSAQHHLGGTPVGICWCKLPWHKSHTFRSTHELNGNKLLLVHLPHSGKELA